MKKDNIKYNGLNRRQFLKVVTSGSALALSGCKGESVEKIIPYLTPPENIIPGVSTWYASVCRECPAGCGINVRTREGRAIKVEGNPQHPINKGKLCARGQASLQGLYNPDRVRGPLKREGEKFYPISWEEAERLLIEMIRANIKNKGGDRIAFISQLEKGSLEELLRNWMSSLGSNNLYFYEPISYEPIKEANKITFGREEIPEFKIDDVRFLISFGADILETWISPVEFSTSFSKMHSYRDNNLGKFVHIEPRLSLTSANANMWIPIKPGTEHILILGMLNYIFHNENISPNSPEFEAIKGIVSKFDLETVSSITEISQERIIFLSRAFIRETPSLALSRGYLGDKNSLKTCIAVNLLNYLAGNIGKTIKFGYNHALENVSPFSKIHEITERMKNGNIDILFLNNSNPVFTLPSSFRFTDALKKVPLVVDFCSYIDETTEYANLILPVHTPLESWGDYSPSNGTYGLIQPIMRPIFNTKPLGDILLATIKNIDEKFSKDIPYNDFLQYLKDSWDKGLKGMNYLFDFNNFWAESLRRGGVWKAIEYESVSLSSDVFKADLDTLDGMNTSYNLSHEESKMGSSFYLITYPSSLLYDGRGANKPWLQETPDPITKITWDSWVEIHPKTAKSLSLREGDVVRVETPNGKIEYPVHIYHGIRKDTVAIPIGQGHFKFGRYANEAPRAKANGFRHQPRYIGAVLSRRDKNNPPNPPLLKEDKGGFSNENSTNLYNFLSWNTQFGIEGLIKGVKLFNTDKKSRHATVVGSSRQEERGIAQAISLNEILDIKSEDHEKHHSLYKEHKHKDHQWAMVIDIDACTGCSACEVACYAENNVAPVGRELVSKGREMAWIWIERFFEGNMDNPEIRFVPMLCQHCHNAPCEPVCPVFATYHTKDGLNAQIYNRCVGTRYCSNNCPYKVRRFNWFTYKWHEPLNLQLNPDISVRDKGVMEKCTFCIQRIREGKDKAKDEERNVRDGEIIPACAQTCPTNAIIFGDLNDLNSQVSKLVKDKRNYKVLEELNTNPSVVYLKKVVRTV